jgi:hypothetical protein
MEPKICELCGRSFKPAYRVAQKYWTKRRFCSEECRGKVIAPPPRIGTGRPAEDRFWEKVDRRSKSQCWVWIGAVDAFGYGFFLKSKNPVRFHKAHRFSWELHNGPIPEGMHVLHHCDKPPCVNPRHLFLGDQAANNADRDRKGRGGDRRGERNGRAILTDKQVEQIRQRYARGKLTQLELGREFGVSEAQVWRIVHRYQRK